MERISLWFRKISSAWVAIGCLIVFVLFTALALPAQAAQAEADSNGAPSPDTSFFYSADDLYASAEAFGEAGRSAYIRARWTFDVIWPIIYTVFLVTMISWVFGLAFRPESKAQLLNLVPLAGMLFDYLENTAATIVMARYPAQAVFAASLATVFTPVKWLFVIGGFIILIVGLLMLIGQRARRLKKRV